MTKKSVEVDVKVPDEKPEPVVVIPKATRKITFEQWASRQKKVKAHHHAGMRAFVKNPEKPRTEDEWNAVFENY